MRFSAIFTVLIALVLVQLGFSVILQVPSVQYPTIQAGIDSAANGDTVLILNGTYLENVNFNSKHIVVASQFITTNDTSHISATILDGGGSGVNQSVVSFLGSEDTLSVLKGLTLTNGWASGSHGGGITIRNGSDPKIEDCVIRNNSGTSQELRGVGIHCTGSAPLFRRCIIRDNVVSNNGNYDHLGGGIYLSGSTGQFIDCQVMNNQIAASIQHRNYGGGVFCVTSSSLFRGCIIANNTADQGGGIDSYDHSSPVLENCELRGNLARDNGGGIAVRYVSGISCDSCVVYQNTTYGNGGGVYKESTCTMTLNQLTITDNTAGAGGAIYLGSGSGNTITNSVVYYNWPNEVRPLSVAGLSYCDVRGGYVGTGNLDYDPYYCDWTASDYRLASNSVCLTGGSGGVLMGYYGTGCGAVTSRTWRVPQDTLLIQDAIFASYQGDTILIAQGSYAQNIQIWGRRVVIGSNYILSGDTADIGQTIVDGGGSGVNQSVVSFLGSEDTLSVLKGLTLTNGWASGSHGGGITIHDNSSPKIEDCWINNNSGTSQEFRGIGINCISSSPQINRCTIKNNSVTSNSNYDHFGGGIYLFAGSQASIKDCKILDNLIAYSIQHRNYGGGIYCSSSSPNIENCYFSGNSADLGAAIQLASNANAAVYNCVFAYNTARDDGGAIYIGNSSPFFQNNTMSLNTAGNRGGGIFSQNSSPIIMNQILWENGAVNGPELYVTGSGTVTVSYSDVQGGWSGIGNIDSDPAFEDTLNFYLSDTSDCIDVGNPDSTYNDPEDPVHPGLALWPAKGGLRNDMGAYGGPWSAKWIFTNIPVELDAQLNLVQTFRLFQNYPNPFNPATFIEFQLPKEEKVNLKVFDLLGREIAQIFYGYLPSGKYKMEWNAPEMASGIYIYRLEAGQFVESKRMILLK